MGKAKASASKAPRGNAKSNCAALLEQLLEHHFDLGQQPAGKR
jgi:hypothetical protein